MTQKQPRRSRPRDSDEPPPVTTRPQSGDAQGLPAAPEADSQSVAELVEEGQAEEAAAVQGVEKAGGAEPSEVTTHQVPEDDVPPEYLEKDQQ